MESNITPWRRAVVGNLTTAFDFRSPNASRRPNLPDTGDFKPVDLTRQPDQVPVPPADQHLPGQERGVRPARALPYTLHADGHASEGSFRIDFSSTGRAAAVFQVYSGGNVQAPRNYTVERGKHLTDTWDLGSEYDLSVHGPNGFFREFKGHNPGSRQINLNVKASYHEWRNEIALTISNLSADRVTVVVRDGYTSRSTQLSLKPGATATEKWSLSRTRGWYDLAVTVLGAPTFERRYAGHLENGADSISDPAMGGLVGDLKVRAKASQATV